MSKLLRRLLNLLLPGVDDAGPDTSVDDAGPDTGTDPDPDTGADPAADTNGDDDDFDFDFVEPKPAGKKTTSDDRLAAVEAQIAEARRLAEARGTFTSPTPAPDPDFQREEERLRAVDTTEMERWQIQSNRALRQNQQMAAQALFQAQDLNDRTAFEAKIASDPHRAKYRDKVEAAVQEERRQGRNTAREAVYYFMLGKDIAEGKLRPKVKAKSSAPDVPRGKPPGVRSNVPSSRSQTEHQKRVARLENMNI